MAEFVEQNLEEMIPELEQMQRVGLFTPAETSVILRKRKAFEYKLKRQTKSKEDFLEYIQYEINVLALVRKRRRNLGYRFKRLEIDVAIVQRIHKLFKMACYRFQADVKLWLSYVEFCKTRKEKVSVSKIFARMLQVHNHKPALWILAAQWELENTDTVASARSIMQRGLRFNAESQKLWQEYFRMELIATDRLITKAKELQAAGTLKPVELSDPALEGQTALTVYRHASEKFPDDVEFLLSFLPLCRLFDFTQPLQNTIIGEIREKHGDSEVVWEAMARLHWNLTQGERSESFTTYEKAVDSLCTEKMWSFYLKACLDDLEEARQSERAEECVARTLDVFQRASMKHCVSADMFVSWMTVLCNVGEVEEADRVSQLAVTKHRTSVALWRQRLQMLVIQQVSAEALTAALTESLECVREKDSLPLWELCVRQCMLTSTDETRALFEKALTAHTAVSQPMSEAYVDWLRNVDGPKAVRKLRKRFELIKRPSLNFYKKCIQAEEASLSPKLRHLRQIFESAVNIYGSNNVDVWLDYIRAEVVHNSGGADTIGAIYWRATKTLDGSLTEQFVSQYALIQAGH